MAEEKEKCEIDIENFIQEFEIDFSLVFKG